MAARGVRALQPYIPGKPIADLEREYGVKDTIKLASNENPLGPPQPSLEAIRAVLPDLALYPDGNGFDLKHSLANRLQVSPGQITLGNGSNDVLSIIAETFLSPGEEAAYSEYAFAIYSLAVQATGATGRMAPANRVDLPHPLGHSLKNLRAQVGDQTRLVFIANPNNPTGTWLSATELHQFIVSLPPTVIVVVDEAYYEYMPAVDRPDTLSWLHDLPNLIVCRTFSKIYGLAGLRIGYAVSHPAVAELLNRVRQPFNVNTLAQVAALAALNAKDHVLKSQEMNQRGLLRLRTGLTSLGWSVPPSAGNFVLADTGGRAERWYEALLRRGIIVRPMSGYGLPHHLRITVGLPQQIDRLLLVLRELRAHDGPDPEPVQQ
ncbi:MAG: histidinol-phosphate transaminase [Gammaproteobacteria bacterium]